MTKNAVEVHNLVKHYGATNRAPVKQALKGVSLSIKQGSFFGLLGPNGAGKSTLINILSGIIRKTSGEVTINGYQMDSHPRESCLSIGVVPQELVVDTFFTVREALDIHAGYYAVPKEKRRTQEIIDALGLTEQANINSRRLSGGMRRRLLIAKALVHNPPVLVLDEPTAGVDVELREQLWSYVRELNRLGTTVLLTTHYLEEAQQLCDMVAIINHGELVAMDSTRALMNRMDSKALVFRFSSPLDELPKSLKEYNASLTTDGQLSVRYQPSRTHAEEILTAVRKSKLEIIDIGTDEPELEDVFKQLTARKKAA